MQIRKIYLSIMVSLPPFWPQCAVSTVAYGTDCYCYSDNRNRNAYCRCRSSETNYRKAAGNTGCNRGSSSCSGGNTRPP
jgi:hypothetical protein